VLGDALVAGDAPLQPLDHAILGDRDDRRGAGIHALADLLQVLVLEALVADLAPGMLGASIASGADGTLNPTNP
jgi:hypothetical protein